jgi:hypothetical protein
MVVGAPNATVNGHVGQGAVYVFTKSNGGWTEQAKLTASDGAAHDQLGYSVAISGTTVVAGAPTALVDGRVNRGAAYVFTQSGGVWTQQTKATAADGAAGDQLGTSVAISDNTVVAGAEGCSATSSVYTGGRAYVFANSGSGWSQQAELSVPVVNGVAGGCGYSVAVSGDTVVLGALNWGAYVFTNSGGAWTLQATLKPAGLSGYPVGQSVAISGGTVVLGVPGGTAGGAAYIFTGSGGSWTQQATLTASDGATPDGFGTSVAISGATVMVGSPGATVVGRAGQGSAYVFTGSGSTWTQQAKVTAADGAAGDQLGYSVAVSGGTVAAGAPYANSLQGAAYGFDGF